MHTLNRVSSNHMRDTYSRGNFELHLIRVSIHVTRKNGYDQFYSKHVSWETSTGTRVFTNNTTSWRQRRRRRRKQPQRQQATTAATTATATTTTTIKLLRNDGTVDDTSNNQLAACHFYIGFLFCFTRLDDNLLTRRRIPISLHLRRQSSSFLFFLNGWLLFLLCSAIVDDFVDCFRFISRDENEFHAGEGAWDSWNRFSGCCESGFTFHCCWSIDDWSSH